MATNVEIANRALQRLGAKTITSLTDGSRNAQAVQACFEPIKLSELRKHVWNFSIKRFQLAADGTPPLFNRANRFPLPAGFVRLLPTDPDVNLNDTDWQIEGRYIVTDDEAPLEVRCVCDVSDPNDMDAIFREVLAAKIAEEICEPITQSNSKKADCAAAYSMLIAEARKANAFENIAQKPPEDEWVTVRR